MVVRRVVWCVGVALLMLSSSSAFGQGRGGAGGGGFFGGGFGGGMMGDPLVGLLRIDEVQKHLELLDDQVAELKKLQEGARGEFRRPDGNFQNLSEEERRKRFAEMQAEAERRNKEMRAKVEEILLPHQLDRLKQLSIQRRGVSALRDPEVAASLKLSDEQKKQLDTIAEETRTKMQTAFQGGGGAANFRDLSEEERRKRFEEMREKGAAMAKESETQTLAVLTDAQKKEFEAMKGEPFTFPQIDFSNFGRRGGAGGGGGDRRRSQQ